MNYQTFQKHCIESASASKAVDPMIELAYLRHAMRQPAASKFGTNPYSRRYRVLRSSVTSPVVLP